jgi:hypothetical protein
MRKACYRPHSKGASKAFWRGKPYGSSAKILRGAPLPLLIFIGIAKTVAPFAGPFSKAATFSKIGRLAAPKT